MSRNWPVGKNGHRRETHVCNYVNLSKHNVLKFFGTSIVVFFKVFAGENEVISICERASALRLSSELFHELRDNHCSTPLPAQWWSKNTPDHSMKDITQVK